MTLAFSRLFGASTQRIEVIALALVVCIGIFELVRRKRLLERDPDRVALVDFDFPMPADLDRKSVV